MVAARDLAIGQEVHDAYGWLTVQQTLGTYGFIDPAAQLLRLDSFDYFPNTHPCHAVPGDGAAPELCLVSANVSVRVEGLQVRHHVHNAITALRTRLVLHGISCE